MPTGPQSQAIPARAGVGLRLPHHPLVLEQWPAVAWFEVHPENYMADADALAQLVRIGEAYPLSLHSVGLSLGSVDGPSPAHLARLVQLERQLRPGLVSDHLAWNSHGGVHLPDLLPLAYTEEALAATSVNVQRVQQALGRRLLVENPSTYLEWSHSAIPEPEFMARLAQRTGCGVLFDVNNVYVGACNHGQSLLATLEAWLQVLDAGLVGEIHLAGHALARLRNGAELRIDDHGAPVCDDVWLLYEMTIARLGAVPTLIEWDTRLPPFADLQHEAALAQQRLDAVPAAVARQAEDGHVTAR